MNKFNLPTTSIKGYPSLKVLDANGNVVKEKTIEPFENIITDFGKRELLFPASPSPAAFFSSLYAAVGTGSIEREATSLVLSNQNGSRKLTTFTSQGAAEVDNLDGTATSTVVHTGAWSVGEITGTISEVGLFGDNTGSELFAGQLIKDGAGNPTTVTILATEQLVVEYTLEITYPNAEEVIGTGSVTDSLGTHNYTIYSRPYISPSNWTAYNRYGPAEDVYIYDPTGAYITDVPYSPTSAWVNNGNGTFTYNTGLVTFSPTSFNGEFKHIYFGAASSSDITETHSGSPVRIEFDTNVLKQSNESLSFTLDLTASVT